MQGLDQHITGNWGEDSVPPEFIKAEDLPNLEGGVEVTIDVGSQTGDRIVLATVESATPGADGVYVKAVQFDYAFFIPNGTDVYFADEDD